MMKKLLIALLATYISTTHPMTKSVQNYVYDHKLVSPQPLKAFNTHGLLSKSAPAILQNNRNIESIDDVRLFLNTSEGKELFNRAPIGLQAKIALSLAREGLSGAVPTDDILTKLLLSCDGLHDELYDAGLWYYTKGYPSKAAQFFEKSELADSKYMLGLLHTHGNKQDQSIRAFNHALKLDTTHTKARKALISTLAHSYYDASAESRAEIHEQLQVLKNSGNDAQSKTAIDIVALDQLLSTQHFEAAAELFDATRSALHPDDQMRLCLQFHDIYLAKNAKKALQYIQWAEQLPAHTPLQASRDFKKAAALRQVGNVKGAREQLKNYFKYLSQPDALTTPLADVAQLILECESDQAELFQIVHTMAFEKSLHENTARALVQTLTEQNPEKIRNLRLLRLMMNSTITSQPAKIAVEKRLLTLASTGMSTTRALEFLQEVHHLPQETATRVLTAFYTAHENELLKHDKMRREFFFSIYCVTNSISPDLKEKALGLCKTLLAHDADKNKFERLEHFIEKDLIEVSSGAVMPTNPDYYAARQLLGQLYSVVGCAYRNHDYLQKGQTLLTPFARSEHIAPSYAACLKGLAEIYGAQNQHLAAIRCLEEAALLVDGSKIALIDYASEHKDAIIEQCGGKQTAEIFLNCTNLAKLLCENQKKSGRCNLKEFTTAFNFLTSEIKISNQDVSFCIRHPDTDGLLECGEFFLQSLQASPDLEQHEKLTIAKAHFDMGVLCCRQARAAEALEHFKKACNAKPSLSALASYHLKKVGDFRSAHVFALSFLKSDIPNKYPLLSHACCTLADCALQDNNIPRMVEYLLRAEQLIDKEAGYFSLEDSTMNFLATYVDRTLEKPSDQLTKEEIDASRIFARLVFTSGDFTGKIASATRALERNSQLGDIQSAIVLYLQRDKPQHLNQTIREKNKQHLMQTIKKFGAGESHLFRLMTPEERLSYAERIASWIAIPVKNPTDGTLNSNFESLFSIFPLFGDNCQALLEVLVRNRFAQHLNCEVITAQNSDDAIACHQMMQEYIAQQAINNFPEQTRETLLAAVSTYAHLYASTLYSTPHDSLDQKMASLLLLLNEMDCRIKLGYKLQFLRYSILLERAHRAKKENQYPQAHELFLQAEKIVDTLEQENPAEYASMKLRIALRRGSLSIHQNKSLSQSDCNNIRDALLKTIKLKTLGAKENSEILLFWQSCVEAEELKMMLEMMVSITASQPKSEIITQKLIFECEEWTTITKTPLRQRNALHATKNSIKALLKTEIFKLQTKFNNDVARFLNPAK